MDKLLESYNLPWLNQEEIENLNRLITHTSAWNSNQKAPKKQKARRNINHLRYADDTTLTAEGEEELKSLSLTVKEKSEKVGLKLSIQKTKIMASGLISWQIEGETMETVTDFICLGSSITVDSGSSHEIKRRLLLGRKQTQTAC